MDNMKALELTVKWQPIIQEIRKHIDHDSILAAELELIYTQGQRNSLKESIDNLDKIKDEIWKTK